MPVRRCGKETTDDAAARVRLLCARLACRPQHHRPGSGAISPCRNRSRRWRSARSRHPGHRHPGLRLRRCAGRSRGRASTVAWRQGRGSRRDASAWRAGAAGFVLGTGLCQRFLASGWPEGLDDAIEAKLAALERTVGQRLGDAKTPLLVSVRSGAPVSMPGMMDTILNLGANRATISALAAQTQDERFALDTWSRFSRMYASTVLGLSADELGAAPAADAPAAMLRADVDKVRGLCARLKMPIPDDPRAQLRGAIEAVFRSSRSARARVFCEREGLAQDMPTARRRPGHGVRQHGSIVRHRRRLLAQSVHRRERALRRFPDQCPGRGGGVRPAHERAARGHAAACSCSFRRALPDHAEA